MSTAAELPAEGADHRPVGSGLRAADAILEATLTNRGVAARAAAEELRLVVEFTGEFPTDPDGADGLLGVAATWPVERTLDGERVGVPITGPGVPRSTPRHCHLRRWRLPTSI